MRDSSRAPCRTGTDLGHRGVSTGACATTFLVAHHANKERRRQRAHQCQEGWKIRAGSLGPALPARVLGTAPQCKRARATTSFRLAGSVQNLECLSSSASVAPAITRPSESRPSGHGGRAPDTGSKQGVTDRHSFVSFRRNAGAILTRDVGEKLRIDTLHKRRRGLFATQGVSATRAYLG